MSLKTMQKSVDREQKSIKSRKHYIVCDVMHVKALRAFTRMTFD